MTESNTFFLSDHHFFHKNIITFCNRPFETVDEMNAEMIRRHNEVVKPDDFVWFLGDFCFNRDHAAIEILKQMNGVKGFIFGNHDKDMRSESLKGHFQLGMFQGITITLQGGSGDEIFKIALSHFPQYIWDCAHHGAFHLFGHVHGNHRKSLWGDKCIDVGADVWNFTPVNFKTIRKNLQRLPQRVFEDFGDGEFILDF